ncbi:hypothetical protein [Lysobacter sp. FW306-1B-D06B]|uniref:XAC0095 family protein n=1 Tax=Lysobacter sp. FW306-1B-D06B TaxID=3140250 RepID=UPI003140263E
MSKDTLAIPAAFRGYLLPRSAHDSLIATREELYMLSHFTEPRCDPAGYFVVRPEGLCALFGRLGRYLDDVLSTVVLHGPDFDDE